MNIETKNIIYGVINPEYTDINEWLELIKHSDKWFYQNGCYEPKINEEILCYSSKKKGIFAKVKVIGIGRGDCNEIISDREHRTSRSDKNKYVEVTLVERYNLNLSEDFKRSDLKGRRQDTFKLRPVFFPIIQ